MSDKPTQPDSIIATVDLTEWEYAVLKRLIIGELPLRGSLQKRADIHRLERLAQKLGIIAS